jgi:6-phosphofructokinase 1
MNTVLALIDDLRDTCESHSRCNVVEVMGRDCGCIALNSGIAAGAVAIAIPEVPFDIDAAIAKIKKVKA